MGKKKRRHRRRRRYEDTENLPDRSKPSRIEPNWRKRHKKRKRSANRQNASAGLAFAFLGGWLNITNEGHHWKIVFPGKQSIQWWPSSAKLVVNEKWEEGIHCHRWQELFIFARDWRKSHEAV
jgi:hypothetical protein